MSRSLQTLTGEANESEWDPVCVKLNSPRRTYFIIGHIFLYHKSYGSFWICLYTETETSAIQRQDICWELLKILFIYLFLAIVAKGSILTQSNTSTVSMCEDKIWKEEWCWQYHIIIMSSYLVMIDHETKFIFRSLPELLNTVTFQRKPMRWQYFSCLNCFFLR